MASLPHLFRAAAVLACLLDGIAHAQSPLPPEPVPLHTAAAFRPLTANWKLAGDVAGDPRRDKTLATTDGVGVLVCNPGKEKETRGHLFTAWEHGDIELDLEFLLPPGSNSGVYLQGRYEVQLFDSWGVREPKAGDCGGIYERYDASRGAGKERFEGHAPRANASRAPGLWQKLHVEFQAPRFDASGAKTRNARFVKVVLNGFVIHENVEATGPTRSAAFNDEKPLGPVMIQGDHGPIAIRRVAAKRFDAGAAIAVDDLRYRLYAGDFKQVGSYDERTPKSEGTPARFAHAAVEKSGKFALVFTGTLTLPRAGDYRFAIESGSMARLRIGERDVVLPLDRGGQPGVVTLAAGRHPFRLDLVHSSNNRPTLELLAEGPGLAPRALTVREREPRAPGRDRSLAVEPTDRVLLQRGFVPFAPRKRLYAASVGTPAGVHYAYDFETGTILNAWRGTFVDTSEMWEGRGNDQVAKPTGPALVFHGRPTVALVEYAQRGDWPDQSEPLWISRGYSLEADGQPVFLGALSELAVHDRIAPAAEGRGLTRTLKFSGKLPSWSTWVFLAEAERIAPQPDGRGWIVGDREWFIDWPVGATLRPVVRTIDGRQQLAVPLASATLDQPLTYTIVW